MLLNDACAESHSAYWHGDPEGVVGKAYRNLKSFCQVRDRQEVHLFGKSRIRARALQQGKLIAAVAAKRSDSFINFGQRSHAGREDYRFARRGYLAEQRQVYDLERSHLVARNSHLFEEIHGSFIKRRGKEV